MKSYKLWKEQIKKYQLSWGIEIVGTVPEIIEELNKIAKEGKYPLNARCIASVEHGGDESVSKSPERPFDDFETGHDIERTGDELDDRINNR